MKSHFLVIPLILSIATATNIKIACDIEYKAFNNTQNIKTCIPSPIPSDSFKIDPPCPECLAFFLKKTDSQSLPTNMSESFPNLEYFIFEDANLTQISTAALKNLTKLIELSFHKNLLTEVPAATFSDNRLLRKISLDANRIRNISAEAFEDLQHLRELYLNDNELVALEPKLFAGNPQLRVINLEMNSIQALPMILFRGLTKLKELKLDYNEIAELPDRIFMGNKELKVFTASFNNISIIGLENDGIFRNMEVLNLLENNCMEELYRGHDIEDLVDILKENCKPECEKEKEWLLKELNETAVVNRKEPTEKMENPSSSDGNLVLKNDTIVQMEPVELNKTLHTIIDMVDKVTKNVESLKKRSTENDEKTLEQGGFIPAEQNKSEIPESEDGSGESDQKIVI